MYTFVRVSLLLLLAATVTACGGSKPATPSPAPGNDPANPGADVDLSPAKGDWLLYHLPAEMPHLNPLTSSDGYGSLVMKNIYDTLLERNPKTLEQEPGLAESWEISDDHLVYSFKIREGVTFSDGHPLTAHDVKFTFDKLMDPTTDAAALRNYFSDIVECKVIDDYNIRFTANRVYYLHLVQLGNYLEVMPKHIFETGNFNDHPNNLKPVGSGRYTLESWNTGLDVTLARNENYWGEAAGKTPAYFDKIIYKIITDDNAQFQVLARGDLDAALVRAEDWENRADTEKFNAAFNKYTFYRGVYWYIGWNLRKPQFQDKEVRQALAMLMDRDLLLDTMLYGHGRVLHGTFLPGTPENDESIAPWPFDPEAAMAKLDAAGWTDSNGNGTRDKDGVEFEFDILITPNNTNAETITTIYQEELARAGIKMGIRREEWATMMERVDKREFDAMTAAWSLDADPDPYQLFHSSQIDKGSNYPGFANAEADDIIDTARQSFDLAERTKLYRRFDQLLHEEQPYLFLFQPESLAAVAKRIHGVVFYESFPVRPKIEWYVPRGLQVYGQ